MLSDSLFCAAGEACRPILRRSCRVALLKDRPLPIPRPTTTFKVIGQSPLLDSPSSKRRRDLLPRAATTR